jgi:hypothetical protein
VSEREQALVPVPEFSSAQAVALRGETAALAQAERQKAQIQARFIVAQRNPRDWDQVRARLLRECRRPGFAAVARYHKPIGPKGVEGMSVRFAEAAARCLTNLLCESEVVFEDDERRQIRVTTCDLEANLSYPIDVMISKTVERRKLPDGETALRVRTNSRGEPVYVVRATEDELLNKVGSAVSKAVRNGILRILPGDIADECETLILETVRNEDAKDPDAAKKKVLDAFGTLNIQPADLKEYLGHALDQVTPAELIELRSLYTALKDGEANWQAALESRGRGAAKKGELPKKEPGKTGLDAAAEALK